MIDGKKWEQMSDEQKLQFCISVDDGMHFMDVTKSDWLLMFEFLLEKARGNDDTEI